MRGKRLLLSMVLLVPAFTVRASDKPLLIELEQRSAARPNGVSASGAVVVGGLGTGGGFYWMPTTGVIFIGGLAANSVSRDGSTIVGTVIDSRVTQAAVWVRAAEWRLLSPLRPGAAPCDAGLSRAIDTSRDGRIVVGYGFDGCGITHALQWDESGVVDLGASAPGQTTLALGVSADGRVTVGSLSAGGFVQGVQWVDRRQELIPGPDGLVGAAQAANSDGSIVVGRICGPAALEAGDPNYQTAWV